MNYWWDAPLQVELGTGKDIYALRRIAQTLGAQKGKELFDRKVASIRMAMEGMGIGCGMAPCHRDASEGHFFTLPDGTVAVPRAMTSIELKTHARLMAMLASMTEPEREKVEDGDGMTWPQIGQELAVAYALGSISFMRVLLHLQEERAESVAHLLLNGDPWFWELLTTGLERADLSLGPEQTEQLLAAFYDHLYSCVESRREVSEVMLDRKARYSCMAMREALIEALDLVLDPPLKC